MATQQKASDREDLVRPAVSPSHETGEARSSTRRSGDATAALDEHRQPFDRVLSARNGLRGTVRMREVWAYRELLIFLTWRDVKVRYRQTMLGASWALIQPFLLMVVFTIFFNRVAHVPSGGVPYPLFAFAGLVPWTLFSSALSNVSVSLVSSSNLISKVYFPRLVIPLAVTGSFILDFVVAVGFLFVIMAYYGVYPGMTLLALPLLMLFTVLTALSVGIWLAALNVKYRDVKYAVPFLIQVWLFASPIAYATSLVPDNWRIVYGLNPMTSVIDGSRWALLGTAWAPDGLLFASLAVVGILLASGLVYFRKTERLFADLV